MKKWMVAALAALVLNVISAHAGQITWLYANYSYIDNPIPLVGTPGMIYLFALGGSEHTFDDGSFNPTTLKLSSFSGDSEFSPLDENPSDFYCMYEGGLIEVDITSEPLNQWWAAVVIIDGLDRFSVDVFYVPDCIKYERGWTDDWEGYGEGWYNSGTEYVEFIGAYFDVRQYAIIPEPATGLLMLSGAALLLLRRKRK